MGIFQDIVARVSKSVGKKRKRYGYSPAKNILRWVIVGVTVLAFACGFTLILGLLDPYSAYGRIAVNVFKPVYMSGNNLLESVFSRFENYTFYQTDASILSMTSFMIALVTLAIIGILAWKHGRTWCNTICPVGTVLGLLSRFLSSRFVSTKISAMDVVCVLPNVKLLVSTVKNIQSTIAVV